jgi:hypothetical protein
VTEVGGLQRDDPDRNKAVRLNAKITKKTVTFLMRAYATIDSTIAPRAAIADIAMPFGSDFPILSSSTPACQREDGTVTSWKIKKVRVML